VNLKNEGKLTKEKLSKFRKDLKSCRNFKVYIHNFTNEIIEKLIIMGDEFKKKFDEKVEFIIGDNFTNADLDILAHSFSGVVD